MTRFVAALILSAALATPAMAQDEVVFNYQGFVRSGGQPFDGTGQFKFSIVAVPGPQTLWSNDGTGVAGNEPTANLSIPVVNGVFNVLVGDPALGMVEINSSVLNHPSPTFLRIWFNDGTHGFQQLHPDHRLVNLTLLTLRSGNDDFTIYVNGATGIDANSGLSPTRAKKTIQAAIETLPERLRCNVTVSVAPGVYREEVDFYGISAARDKKLLLVGDTTWLPTSAGDPTVRITGRDSDSGSPPPVREHAVYARQCSGVEMQGFLLDYTKNGGAWLIASTFNFVRCKAANNAGYGGIVITEAAQVNCTECVCNNNTFHGFGVTLNSKGWLTSCVAQNNGGNGVSIDTHANVNLYGKIDCVGNGYNGISVQRLSFVGFDNPFTGSIATNANYGLYVNYNSIATGTDRPSVNWSGNPQGDKYAHLGGVLYP